MYHFLSTLCGQKEIAMSTRVEGKVRTCCRSEKSIQSATDYLLMVTEMMGMIEALVAGVLTRSCVHSYPGPNESQAWSSALKKTTLPCKIKPYKKTFFWGMAQLYLPSLYNISK